MIERRRHDASGRAGRLRWWPSSLSPLSPAGDLAVIKGAATSGLRPAVFADSSQTRVGEIVLAMGNPLGLSAA